MVPLISIHSQRGLIGIESKRGKFEIERPKPQLNIQSTPAVITASNKPGELRIDQSLTDNALTGGKPTDFWQRIYSQYREIGMRNIQEIVEKGNAIGDLRNKADPMPSMALDAFIEGAPDLQVYGSASSVNIAFQYTPNDPNVEISVGGVEINAQVSRPEINFQRGGVNIFMQQYAKVTITPPVINLHA